ncbi:hypothetical protein [Parafrankia sp. EAN1pec]
MDHDTNLTDLAPALGGFLSLVAALVRLVTSLRERRQPTPNAD